MFPSIHRTRWNGSKDGGNFTSEITHYVYEPNKHLSSISKKNVLTNLSVLFNFLVRRDLPATNPVAKIDRPMVPFRKPHVLRPTYFETLFKRCFSQGWTDRLVMFVLVGFCGIRTEEASRLKWSNLQLDRNMVEIPATVAKKASFRSNPTPRGITFLLSAPLHTLRFTRFDVYTRRFMGDLRRAIGYHNFSSTPQMQMPSLRDRLLNSDQEQCISGRRP